MIQFNKVDIWSKRAIYLLFVLFFSFTAYQTFPASFHILTDAAYYLMGAENLALGNGFYSYNVGYLSNTNISDFKELIPITRYQPLYPFSVAITINTFEISALMASRLVNLFFYGIFLLTWINLYRRIFYNTKVFLFSALFLIFPIGISSYLLPPHSEMLFLALLGILGNLIFVWSQSENKIKRIGFTFLLAFISILILLTRYAGVGFVFGFFTSSFFIFQRISLKEKILHFFVYSLNIAIGFGLWAYRNVTIMGSVSSRYPDSYHGTIFDFERIIEIINQFLAFSLGFPSSFENYLFLLLIPIIGIILILFYFRSYNRSSISLWLLISVFIYVAMVVYMGIGNRSVSRINGFMRFFALTQPFLIGILLILLQSLMIFRKNILFTASKLFIIGLLAVSLLSGINRTRIFFQTLPQAERNTNFYENINRLATKNDLILSNQWQNVSAKTSLLPIVQIDYKTDIEILKKKYRGKYDQVFLILIKNVGVSYREGVDVWDTILEGVDYYKIRENDEAIFVRVN